MSHLIAPSILSCNFAHVGRDVEMICAAGADWIHVDVMDGMFVPNMSFGLPVVEAMKRHTSVPLDVHLMVHQPERYLTHFRNAGADIITIHVEACVHLHAAIQQIHQLGAKAGVALNPSTPVQALEEVLPDLDVVCLMSVNPGWGGQQFIEASLAKIEKLQSLIHQTGSKALIEVDGGIKADNALQVLKAGAQVLVSGSGIFGQSDIPGTIQFMKSLQP